MIATLTLLSASNRSMIALIADFTVE